MPQELITEATPGSYPINGADFVGPRIKELCDKQQITKYRLSKMTGITQTVLANIIHGDSIPTIRTLEKICCALNISLAQFFAKEERQPDLTAEQQEIIETWNGLNQEERDRLMKIVRTFQ
ncbi:MAG: helix-turn-helix transcriptional regulator [Lachnospiraceae bacterium]|nr:helix-turn-helix transcriptional regulator [Lachnospiraceae bacterium]